MRWALTSLLLCACGTTQPSAATASRALLGALARADAAELAELTGRPEPEAHALLDDARAELTGLGAELASTAPELRGRAYLESGGVVSLVHEDGGWRIASGILGVPSLETPIDAIRALHATLGRIEGTGFLGILSRETRLSLHEELDRWWRGTADPDAIGIAIDGDVATAITPSGGTIELHREAGEWRIVDLH